MTDVSVGFQPPCWCPYGWAPAWRLHTNIYKFGKKFSLHISHKKNSCDQNFGESLCIDTFFHFPDSGLYLLTGFDFDFDLFWIAWHWKPAIFKEAEVLPRRLPNFGKANSFVILTVIYANFWVRTLPQLLHDRAINKTLSSSSGFPMRKAS